MKIIKNYIYNVFYQVLSVIIPFFTIPYVSRTLGAENIGINSFTAANTQYFVLLATMGISLYATREISYLKDDKHKLSNLFWEIMFLKILLFLASYAIFIIFIISNEHYKVIYLLQSVAIITALFDVSWFFMGIQNFKVTVLRNTLVKVLSIILIFILVKNKEDLTVYIIILVLSSLLGNISVWPYLKKNIEFPKFNKINFKRHVSPIITLFIPQIAIQVFTVVNKTILGIYSSPVDVGLFENADKIIRVMMAIVTASGMVLLPAISQFFISDDYEKVRKYMYKGFDYISFISIPLSIGLIAIAGDFGIWFFGTSFAHIDIVLALLSIVLVFMAWNNTFSSQFLIPAKHENWYTQSFIYGAVLNIILNICLDKNMGAVGAAISAMIAETFVVLYQINKIKYFFSIRKLFKNVWKYYLSALAMGLFIFFINKNLQFNMSILVMDIFIGSIIYLGCNLLLHVPIFNDFYKYMSKKGVIDRKKN